MTDLKLTGLVKRYGRVTALDGLSLEVRRRRVLLPAGAERGGQDHDVAGDLRASSGSRRGGSSSPAGT